MSPFMLVEGIFAVKCLMTLFATELRFLVRLLVALQVFLSAKGLVAKRALMAFHSEANSSAASAREGFCGSQLGW
jgi:hypothetical protein